MHVSPAIRPDPYRTSALLEIPASPVQPLSVTRLTDEQALVDLEPEWAALEQQMSPRLPFKSPLWNILWWKHFRRTGLFFRDHLQLYTVRDALGALIAVAPMMLSHRPAIGPLRVRELQFFGADSNVTELRGIVCRPEDMPDVVEALTEAMHAHKAEWDWVQWRGLRNAPNAAGWQQRIAGLRSTSEILDYYLPLPETWDEFRSALPRNIKESLRKCYNSLARDGHDFVFNAVQSPDEIPGAIDLFLELHTQRAELPGTVRHPNAFASQKARAFLHDYALAMAQRDAVRVFQLIIGGKVVACRIAFLLGDEMYLYFSGYCPDWSRYSVMTTVTAEALKWAIAHKLSIANLSTGTDVSKTRWRPVQVSHAEGIETAPTLRGPIVTNVMDRLRSWRLQRSSPLPS